MASQSTHYGKLEMTRLGGGKLVQLVGSVKFTSSATVATVPVPMKNQVVYVGLSWKSPPGAKQSVIPWSSGAISGGSILVQRKTGTASGMTAYVEVLGW